MVWWFSNVQDGGFYSKLFKPSSLKTILVGYNCKEHNERVPNIFALSFILLFSNNKLMQVFKHAYPQSFLKYTEKESEKGHSAGDEATLKIIWLFPIHKDHKNCFQNLLRVFTFFQKH